MTKKIYVWTGICAIVFFAALASAQSVLDPFYILTKGGNKCLFFGQFSSKAACELLVEIKYGPLATGECFGSLVKCSERALSQGAAPGSLFPVPPSQAALNIFPAPTSYQVNYYYCAYREKRCFPFASFFSKEECQKELRRQMWDKTDQICYPSYSSCASQCQPAQTKSFFYCMKDAGKCNPTKQYVSDIPAYAEIECKNDLNKFLSNLTTGQCFGSESECVSNCAAKGFYYFCVKDAKQCKKTSQAYDNAALCEQNLAKYYQDKTDGKCYGAPEICDNACASVPPASSGRSFLYCMTDIKQCSQSEGKYNSKEECETFLKTKLAGKTSDKCYELADQNTCASDCLRQTPPAASGKFWYCILAAQKCDDTVQSYNSVQECETNLKKYMGSSSNGKCYSDEPSCKTVCAGATTPPENPPNSPSPAQTQPASYISGNFAFLEGKITDASLQNSAYAWFELSENNNAPIILPSAKNIIVSSPDTFFYPAFNLKSGVDYSYTLFGKRGTQTFQGTKQTFSTK